MMTLNTHLRRSMRFIILENRTRMVEMRERGDCCYAITDFIAVEKSLIGEQQRSAEAAFDLFEKPVFTSSFNRPLFPQLRGIPVYPREGPV